MAVLREEGLDVRGEVDGILRSVLARGGSPEQQGDEGSDKERAGLHALSGPQEAFPLPKPS
jgi:hypothetical protein